MYIYIDIDAISIRKILAESRTNIWYIHRFIQDQSIKYNDII